MLTVFDTFLLILFNISHCASLHKDILSNVFRFIGIRNQTNYRLINHKWNNAIETALNNIYHSLPLFERMVDHMIHNKITNEETLNLKLLFNEYKSNQLFQILSQIPHIIKTSSIQSKQSAKPIKLNLESFIESILISHHKNTTETFEQTLTETLSIHLSQLSTLMLPLYINNRPGFNYLIIYYQFLWDCLSLPSLHAIVNSSSSSSSNSLIDFMDKYPVLLWNPSSRVTFDEHGVGIYFYGLQQCVEILQNKIETFTSMHSTLLTALHEYWILYITSIPVSWQYIHRYMVYVPRYKYIMTQIISRFIMHSQYDKLEEFLRNLKKNDAIFMLENTRFIDRALLSECALDDWHQILSIFFKYIRHQMDVEEQIVFTESTYLWQLDESDPLCFAQYDDLYTVTEAQFFIMRYYVFKEQEKYVNELSVLYKEIEM